VLCSLQLLLMTEFRQQHMYIKLCFKLDKTVMEIYMLKDLLLEKN
jgi:hypothetical protein